MFSEAEAHNQVWKVFPDCGSSAAAFYRRLLLAMGRRRLESYRWHFIKFTSYNIMQFGLIRAAFPDTPALFLFRDPDAVLDSSAREAQPWLGMDVGFGRVWSHADAALGDFCRAALAIRDSRFRCLNYPGITPRNLPSILRFFGCEPSPRELALMESEFLWDAKSGRVPRRFVPRDTAAGLADSCLLALYRELDERSRLDWAQQPA